MLRKEKKMTVFESSVTRTLVEPKTDEIIGDWKKHNDQIKEDEIKSD
jgi:hypothetical protein